MSSVLDKEMVESLMPREYEYLHHGVTQLGIQSKLSKSHCIIASSRGSTGVPLVPGHGRTTSTPFLFTIGIAFYCEVHH